MMIRNCLTIGLVFWALASGVRADVVVLSGGDRLTGTVTGSDNGKLLFVTPATGEISVDLASVSSFSTDAPISVRLKDGRILDAQAVIGEDGMVVLGEPVPLDALSVVVIPPVKWTGSLTLNGAIARGNTDSESFGFAANATRRSENDRIALDAAYLFGRAANPDTGDKSTNTDTWWASGKYDYFFDERLYGYANVRGESDRIAGLRLRLTPGVGVGYQWIETSSTKVHSEAGLTWVYEDYKDAGENNHIAARLAYRLEHDLNDAVSVFHALEYLQSLEDVQDFNVFADAGLRAKVTGQMFAEGRFEWRYDATPGPDADTNDIRFLFGVGWTF